MADHRDEARPARSITKTMRLVEGNARPWKRSGAGWEASACLAAGAFERISSRFEPVAPRPRPMVIGAALGSRRQTEGITSMFTALRTSKPLRNTVMALALGTLTAGALAPTSASAFPGHFPHFPGGHFPGGHFPGGFGHWGGWDRWGGPFLGVPVVIGRSCEVSRFIDDDGVLVVRKVCD
jgi:hypothetical protein